MHQILFVASEVAVAELDIEDNPAQSFPCMSSQQFHRDARAQLYALVTGSFLDESYEMEYLAHTLADQGPYIYRLQTTTQEALARLEEDQVEELAEDWMNCEEIEQLDLDANDLHEFLFQYIHFCQVANNDDLGLFIYSDD